MENNNVKTFMCFFANGMVSIMGADSKEDALKAVKAMELRANARLVGIEEMKDIVVNPYDLPTGQPQLNDGTEPEPDDDIDMGF